MWLAMLITVGALAISIIVSSIFVRLTHSKDEFQRGVIISLVLTIFVSLSFLRYEASKLIEPIAAVAKALSEEQISATFIQYQKTLDAMVAHPNPVMREILQLKFKRFKDSVNEFSKSASLEVPLEDITKVAMRAIQSAKHSIKATSYVDSRDWWKSHIGKPYFHLNEKQIMQGVTIERIFVFDNEEEMRKEIDLLVCNAEIGVKVSVLVISDLSHPFGEDVVIIDDSALAGLARFGPSKELRDSIYSSDPDFIKDRLNSFEMAALNAQPFVIPAGAKCNF